MYREFYRTFNFIICSVETTALRLITSFNSVDVHTQFSRIGGECKSLVSAESEELNRALVLTIARAVHVTGNS